MAELRVLLTQQGSSPSSQPSSTLPFTGTVLTTTQAQLTSKKEQDLQAQLLVAQQTIVDLKVCLLTCCIELTVLVCMHCMYVLYVCLVCTHLGMNTCVHFMGGPV